MAFFVYILKSINYERFYVGSTQDLTQRLERHNQGRSKATKPYRPWQIVYVETYQTRSEAVRRERQIKNRKSSEFINQLVQSQSV